MFFLKNEGVHCLLPTSDVIFLSREILLIWTGIAFTFFSDSFLKRRNLAIINDVAWATFANRFSQFDILLKRSNIISITDFTHIGSNRACPKTHLAANKGAKNDCQMAVNNPSSRNRSAVQICIWGKFRNFFKKEGRPLTSKGTARRLQRVNSSSHLKVCWCVGERDFTWNHY